LSKDGIVFWQLLCVKYAMFSIIPKTGTLIALLRTLILLFLASARATACGVLTTTAPVTVTTA
jgi:hypothetical protein